ncbi:MAG: hypothetical protein WKF90_06300 [Pyrinomonadaceae bacterium]
MNNLTQKQQQAKQAFLNRQHDEMLAIYQNAEQNERNATIEQIDSFLSVVPQDAKVFWLRFRHKLEMLNESKVLFPLGNVYLTIGTREALEESNQAATEFLARHQKGDWGIVGKEDWKENDFSVTRGFRILSAYKTSKGEKLWCITEACRSSTTILLPEEY